MVKRGIPGSCQVIVGWSLDRILIGCTCIGLSFQDVRQAGKRRARCRLLCPHPCPSPMSAVLTYFLPVLTGSISMHLNMCYGLYLLPSGPAAVETRVSDGILCVIVHSPGV